jgi:hypothetical protein
MEIIFHSLTYQNLSRHKMMVTELDILQSGPEKTVESVWYDKLQHKNSLLRKLINAV